jgi:poly(hydroxyalkanoate) depolymerase family esterase
MRLPSWSTLLNRNAALVREAGRTLGARYQPPPGAGSWLMGLVMAADGPRRYYLFRPAGTRFGEKLPMLVMLHGCHQDARSFAASTRMNLIAARERFLVLYPEQPRLAHAQACWHWFDTASGRAQTEMAWVLKAMDQAAVLYAADRERTAVAGLSAGASLAALLASTHPQRFKAVVMHSGVPPGLAHSAATALSAMRGRRTAVPLEAAQGWPPLLVIQGEGDAVVAARNGEMAAQRWAHALGAEAQEPQTQQRGKRLPMTVTHYRRGTQLAATLVMVEGMGHAWSGGAARQRFGDARGPDASRLAWRFVAQQLKQAGG